MTRKKLEQSGMLALQMLRKTNLGQGHSFMINSGELPSNQSYMEYPDGTMQLVVMSHSKSYFEVIKEFSAEEGFLLKKRLQLSF